MESANTVDLAQEIINRILHWKEQIYNLGIQEIQGKTEELWEKCSQQLSNLSQTGLEAVELFCVDQIMNAFGLLAEKTLNIGNSKEKNSILL